MSRLFSEEISGNPDLPGKDEGRGRLPFLKEPGENMALAALILPASGL